MKKLFKLLFIANKNSTTESLFETEISSTHPNFWKEIRKELTEKSKTKIKKNLTPKPPKLTPKKSWIPKKNIKSKQIQDHFEKIISEPTLTLEKLKNPLIEKFKLIKIQNLLILVKEIIDKFKRILYDISQILYKLCIIFIIPNLKKIFLYEEWKDTIENFGLNLFPNKNLFNIIVNLFCRTILPLLIYILIRELITDSLFIIPENEAKNKFQESHELELKYTYLSIYYNYINFLEKIFIILYTIINYDFLYNLILLYQHVYSVILNLFIKFPKLPAELPFDNYFDMTHAILYLIIRIIVEYFGYSKIISPLIKKIRSWIRKIL